MCNVVWSQATGRAVVLVLGDEPEGASVQAVPWGLARPRHARNLPGGPCVVCPRAGLHPPTQTVEVFRKEESWEKPCCQCDRSDKIIGIYCQSWQLCAGGSPRPRTLSE